MGVQPNVIVSPGAGREQELNFYVTGWLLRTIIFLIVVIRPPSRLGCAGNRSNLMWCCAALDVVRRRRRWTKARQSKLVDLI
jgi:hypothetical protein